MSKVAIVILNWNGIHFLQQFLPFTVKYSNYPIIIADNASSDDSIHFIQQNYPNITIIPLNSNKGFAEGYNLALKQINAQYYILLNSDIEVTPNWIDPIIELMDADQSIAVCQPKILSFHNKQYFEYAGAAGGFIDKLGYPFCRGRIFQHLEPDNNQYNDNIQIFWATGACMFVRADMFHLVNGFDPDFFAHMEEIDFCWRIKKLGYKIMYSANSTVYHVGGGTLPKINPRKTYLNFRNNLTLLLKNLPASSIPKILAIRLVLDIIAAISFLIKGFHKDALAVLKAYISFYSNLTHHLKKRQKNTPRVNHIYNKSIVWQYYIMKNKTFNKLNFFKNSS